MKTIQETRELQNALMILKLAYLEYMENQHAQMLKQLREAWLNFDETSTAAGEIILVPEKYMDPISNDLILDPFLANDCQTYDQPRLNDLVARKEISPVTRRSDLQGVEQNEELKKEILNYLGEFIAKKEEEILAEQVAAASTIITKAYNTSLEKPEMKSGKTTLDERPEVIAPKEEEKPTKRKQENLFFRSSPIKTSNDVNSKDAKSEYTKGDFLRFCFMHGFLHNAKNVGIATGALPGIAGAIAGIPFALAGCDGRPCILTGGIGFIAGAIPGAILGGVTSPLKAAHTFFTRTHRYDPKSIMETVKSLTEKMQDEGFVDKNSEALRKMLESITKRYNSAQSWSSSSSSELFNTLQKKHISATDKILGYTPSIKCVGDLTQWKTNAKVGDVCFVKTGDKFRAYRKKENNAIENGIEKSFAPIQFAWVKEINVGEELKGNKLNKFNEALKSFSNNLFEYGSNECKPVSGLTQYMLAKGVTDDDSTSSHLRNNGKKLFGIICEELSRTSFKEVSHAPALRA